MTKKPRRNATARPTTQPTFVVWVTFPSSSKEYCYLCNIAGIQQGSEVMANGTRVRVLRTEMHNFQATRWVYPLPDQRMVALRARKEEITKRLREIGKELAEQEWMAGLAKRSPEARKLWAELKQIVGEM